MYRFRDNSISCSVRTLVNNFILLCMAVRCVNPAKQSGRTKSLNNYMYAHVARVKLGSWELNYQTRR